MRGIIRHAQAFGAWAVHSHSLALMITTTRRRLAFAVAALVVVAAGCRPAVRINGMAPVNDAATAIPAVMNAMADAWNNNDIAAHIRPYADSATFMGANGPIRGRDRVGESLARSFWRDGKAKQRLSFDRIVIRPLGENHALQTGHFLLTGGGESDKQGWFSLTWENTANGWRIIHDHSG